MNELRLLAPACLAGGVLGAVFFGGLWWTVRRAVASKLPALWFSGSFLLRMSIVIAGFYFIPGRDWQEMLACLFGFVAARLAVIRLTRPPEACHAP